MKRKSTNTFIRFIKTATLLMLFLMNYLHSNAQCYSQPNYCLPTVTNIANYGMGMQNVTLGSTINNSTSATGNAPNYFDYTNMSFSASPATVVNFSVKNGSSNSTQVKIYIDWNLDGTFGTTAPELVWTSKTTTAGATVSDTFSIPSGQVAGLYRVRVAGDYGASPSGDPCKLNYGEVEDYSLIVTSSKKDGLAFSHVSPTSFYVGNDTIRFSMFNLTDTVMTKVDIGYQLDNNTAVTQSLTGLTVAAGAMDTIKFDTLLKITTAGTYNLKVWINNVNGGGTQTANNDTICRTFVVCTTPLNGNYTINASGSGGSNFLTFKEAVTKLINCGVSGPVVFKASAATFNEQITIPLISGTSSTNTILFEGVDSSSTILTFDGVASAPHTVLLSGTKFINFRNMRIRASGATYGVPVFINNSDSNTVRGCVLEITKALTSSSAAGIAFSGSSTSFAATSNCRGNYIDSNRITGGYYNIVHGGNNGSAVNYIRRNKLQNAYYYGIYQNSSSISTNKIIGNTFEMATGNNNSSCIYLINGTPSAGYYHEIKENIFLRTGLYHIYILTSQGGQSANTAGEIFNNFFGGAFNNTSTAGCINMYGQNWKIYHNSFNMTGTASTNSFCFSVYGGTNNIDVRNNIFANSQTGGANYAVDINNNNAISTFDYNQLYSTNTNVMRVGGANYQVSNLFASAYPNGAGLNSIFQAPGYVSTTDLHVKAICNNGANLSVSTDIDGQTRNNPPDMGADENTTSPAVDVAVMQISAPTFPISAGSQSLSAIIKNVGSDSLSSLTVYYSFNNAIDSETFTFSPSLQICDTATVTFTNNISIGSGSNTIKVYTVYPGDSFAGNDTARKTFCVSMAGYYTINSSISASATNFTSFTSAIAQLSCGGVSGAVTFGVSANTYNEQISIGIINGVSSTNTVTFIGRGSDSTVITYSGSAGAPYTISLSGTQYVTFRDMNIRATNITYGWAVSIASSNYNKIAKCKIECSGPAATSNSSSLATVVINGSGISIGTSGANDGNYIDSNIINGGYYGIACFIPTASNINYFRNNDITDSYYYGIYASGSQTLKILNNNIQNRASNANSIGIYFNSVYANSNVSGAYHEIKGNYINYVGQAGMYFQNSIGGTAAAHGEMLNNMVGGVFASNAAVYGIFMSYAQYWDVYHNSISIATATGSSHRAFYIASTQTKSSYKNNSIAITNAKGAKCVAIEVATGSVPDSLNYNNYYNVADTSLVLIGTQSYNSTNYQVAFPNGGGGQSIDGNPHYNSAADLHVTGTQLDNHGDALGVAVDIDDDTRSSSNPDIGADEYSAKSSHDFAMNKLTSPAAASCLGGYNQTITVSIKNVGTDTIYLTNDTAWVSAEVTDPNSNVITYGPVAVTGKTFYPKDAMTIDITNKFDMSDIGTYAIRPYVSYSKDPNNLNDTIQNLTFDETNPVPVLSFIPSTSICSNDSVKLSAVNSKNTSDFQWYYNNSPVFGAIDSVFYATQAGTYYVNVADNLYSGCSINSDTITVKVGSAPTASFTVSQIAFCSGDSSMLKAQGGSANNYQWLLNTAIIAGATDSVYYAKVSGNYSVVVQDNTSGCAALSSSSKLTAYASPTSVISYVGNGIKCVGDSLKLSSTPGNGLTYQWMNNGSNISGATDSIYYAKATGNYQIAIINGNGCKSVSVVSSILVDLLPSSTVNVTGNPTACGMDTVHLDAVNNANNTYQWMESGNAINGATSSSLTVYTNGSYTLKVTNGSGCSTTSPATTVAYKAIPAIPTVNGTANSTICVGDSVMISVSANGTGSFTYQWKLNGTNITGATDSIYYAGSAGTYTASVANSGGCSALSATSINVSQFASPNASLTAAGNNIICYGDSVGLTAATSTVITSISWWLNTKSLSNTGNSIYVKTAGPYTAKITDNNGCKATTAAVNVFVNPLPVAVVTQDIPNNELSTTTFSSYQWYKNGVIIPGATSQKLKVYSNGSYTVEVVDANGCKGVWAASTVIWGGIATEVNTFVNVYPNPSQGLFNIELPEGTDMKQLYITDIAGKQIVVNSYEVNKNIYTVDLSEKAAGIYILHMTQGAKTIQARLIKY